MHGNWWINASNVRPERGDVRIWVCQQMRSLLLDPPFDLTGRELLKSREGTGKLIIGRRMVAHRFADRRANWPFRIWWTTRTELWAYSGPCPAYSVSIFRLAICSVAFPIRLLFHLKAMPFTPTVRYWGLQRPFSYDFSAHRLMPRAGWDGTIPC